MSLRDKVKNELAEGEDIDPSEVTHPLIIHNVFVVQQFDIGPDENR
jgi:hypothetical protein